MIQYGYDHTLEKDHLPPLSREEDAQESCQLLEHAWDYEKRQRAYARRAYGGPVFTSRSHWALYFAIFRAFKSRLLFGMICYLFVR